MEAEVGERHSQEEPPDNVCLREAQLKGADVSEEITVVAEVVIDQEDGKGRVERLSEEELPDYGPSG